MRVSCNIGLRSVRLCGRHVGHRLHNGGAHRWTGNCSPGPSLSLSLPTLSSLMLPLILFPTLTTLTVNPNRRVAAALPWGVRDRSAIPHPEGPRAAHRTTGTCQPLFNLEVPESGVLMAEIRVVDEKCVLLSDGTLFAQPSILGPQISGYE